MWLPTSKIIHSVLDTDLYKLTMAQAILSQYPHAQAEYVFCNRDKSFVFGNKEFTPEKFKAVLRDAIVEISELALCADEEDWLKANCRFVTPAYLEYLRNYRFKPKELEISNTEGDLQIRIRGPWHSTVMWEVPLMAVVSELYFKHIDTNWHWDRVAYQSTTKQKAELIAHPFAEFGTRRRRSYKVQDATVEALQGTSCVGTSNVHLAMKYDMKAIGTLAHEWVSAVAILDTMNHPNRAMMDRWNRVYKGDLGIALTDTFGTDSFLRDFDLHWAKLYDGCRHDSGLAIEFADKMIAHYKKLGIDPLSKVIIFSDGLNAEKAAEIRDYCEGKIKCSFGIGTHFSNDFEHQGSRALNIVIKLWSINGTPAVKLSDTPTKAIGDPDAVQVMRWIHMGLPLSTKA